jgi:broad specificity phosphatase PhoE
MTIFFIIRHGETDWNIDGRYQGQADPPLNARGVQQAKMLAEQLMNKGLEIVVTSPLERAKQTAVILSQVMNVQIMEEPRLMEIHQGDWQTRLRSEIESLYPDLFAEWETNPWHVTPPGGEPLSTVQARVYAALDDLGREYPEAKIGIVTHRIPIVMIKMRYQSLDPDIVRTIHLPNTYWEEIIPPTA